MKTAVIYARYSSDSQTEQSIEGQLRVCQDFAKNNEILIVDTYIDRAMTGTNDLRPDFQRMIKDSNKKQWDYVIVYKLDRFSRNKYETTIHKHTLSNNGIKVLSAMENIPDTPEGIILESLLEGMNQYYSAELSQKVHRGLNESYIKGQFTGGIQLYGYNVVEKKNVIDDNEAQIVREIFSRYQNGETVKAIGDNLVARGIRTKRGHYMDEKRIYKTLGNTKYIGKVTHGDKIYTNIYPAIVDEITWQNVQAIRNSNKHKPGATKPKFKFLLSGKLICGDCGSFLVGESGNSKSGEMYKYYSCLTRRRRKKPCNFISVSKEWLEDEIFNKTWELICDNNNLDWLANEICKRHSEKNKENMLIKSLEKKRAEALKASNNLISAIEQGIITEQTKIRLKELENQISQYDFDIEQVKQRNYTYLSPDDVKQFLQKAISGEIDSFETRSLIVRTLIRQIVIYNDKLIITYNFIDKNLPKKTIPDKIEDIKMAIKQENTPVYKKDLCSYRLTNSPPNSRNPNANKKAFVFFNTNYFMIQIKFNKNKSL